MDNKMVLEYLKKLNLNELKTILYVNKKLNDNSKKLINEIIEFKIKNSFNKKINIAKKTNTNVNTNSDIDTSNTSDKSDTSDTSYSIESINITNNIRTNKNKYDKYNKNIDIETISSSDTDNKPNNSISKVLYDKNTRKYKNQNITNTSDKLLNRMMSEAQYINDISTSGINKISHPYAEDHINKTHELGKRKNIKK